MFVLKIESNFRQFSVYVLEALIVGCQKWGILRPDAIQSVRFI